MVTDVRKVSLYVDEAWCFTERAKRILGIFLNRQMRRKFGLEEKKEGNTEI
jgi:hypothetical protein